MDGFPQLVQVIDNERTGRMAFYADGMVARYDFAHDVWRPATAHISYADLFTTTVKRDVLEPNRELSAEVGDED